MFVLFLFSLLLSTLLIFLNSFLGKKSQMDREKLSPFECGFDPKSSARLPFSLRFYLIALIFLIFDVEITLILPIPILMTQMNMTTMMFLSSFFLMILIIGLFHEWSQGALEWDK
uniref:NADH-ubiquinone oxidoreductase chain 3 n=1 Tax=Dicranocentrus wangi TaxID=1302322 RepID=A0A6H0EVT2_9HEXA|nr:NADH dehydrogenase subunit 3 [Dicranocentrus wangi]QIT06438.1 NADH dehydrogenase subunit 3 [Dicranocentrus wangi]